MTTISVRKVMRAAAVGMFAVASFAIAQDQTPNSTNTTNTTAPTSAGGWRRVGDAPQSSSQQSVNQSSDAQISQSAPNGPNAAPNIYPDSGYPQSQPQSNYPQAQAPQSSQQPVGSQIPAHLTIPAGTYLTVRVNQQISSDHNQVGDAFSATLVRPVVANGVVIAAPGQTIGGRVAQVQRSGHVSGLAKLGVELTDLTLVDGQQLPVKTTFVSRSADSTVGRDAGAIAGTTALGAAIGAAADWGRGAAIGAGAGLVASTIGVLVTRGQPSVIFPEQVLTFKLEQPLDVSTERAPQAFRYVQPNEYGNQTAGYGYGAPAPYPPAPGPYAYGYPYYGYPYYPYAGFSFFVGPGYYGRGFYGPYRGGYYGRPFVRGGVVVRR